MPSLALPRVKCALENSIGPVVHRYISIFNPTKSYTSNHFHIWLRMHMAKIITYVQYIQRTSWIKGEKEDNIWIYNHACRSTLETTHTEFLLRENPRGFWLFFTLDHAHFDKSPYSSIPKAKSSPFRFPYFIPLLPSIYIVHQPFYPPITCLSLSLSLSLSLYSLSLSVLSFFQR
jgi:hypothetical protein